MKLPDSEYNIDVKSAHTFQNPIILRGVMPRQDRAEIKKNNLYLY